MRDFDRSRDLLDQARVEAFYSCNIAREASYLYSEMVFAISQGDLQSTLNYGNEILDLDPEWAKPVRAQDLRDLRLFRIRTFITLAYVESLSGNISGHLNNLQHAYDTFQGFRKYDLMLYSSLLASIAIAQRDFGSHKLCIRLNELADDQDMWPEVTSIYRADIYRSLAWTEAQDGNYSSALCYLSRSVEVTSDGNFKTLGSLQRAFFSQEIGESINAIGNLETAKRYAELTSWSMPHAAKTTLAQLAQEVSNFNPETARQIFAKFLRFRPETRDGLFSTADNRYLGHELIAEAVVQKNSGNASSAEKLLIRAFSIWDDLNYGIYAAWAAVELAELDASPRFAEYARKVAKKHPRSWLSKRCAKLSQD